MTVRTLIEQLLSFPESTLDAEVELCIGCHTEVLVNVEQGDYGIGPVITMVGTDIDVCHY